MQFKKLLEDINDGWELEDNYDVDLNVLDDMNSFIYEIRNTIRGAYTKATTYKELATYIRNDLIQPLEYLAQDIENIKENDIDESLKESNEEIEDISYLIFDSTYGNKEVEELDVSSLSEVDHYYKLIKTVNEAEKFNYHSDY